MSNITEELKKKFGGKGQTIAEVVKTMESGSGLPEVTAEDNGDVLTVVEGAWDKASPSGGGGGMFLVTIDGNDGSCDKTWGELKAAFEAGMIPVLAYIEYGSETPKYITMKDVTFSSRFIVFDNMAFSGTSDDDPLTPYE